MDKIVFYALFFAGFLLVAAIGCWVTEKVLPRFKRIDSYLGDIARQKKD